MTKIFIAAFIGLMVGALSWEYLYPRQGLTTNRIGTVQFDTNGKLNRVVPITECDSVGAVRPKCD